MLANNHLEYSDKFPGMIVRSHNLKYLAAKIAPYVYQVSKAECLDAPREALRNPLPPAHARAAGSL